MRWLRPPPARTAAFSRPRRPGVVLRVSRIAAPVPATASTKRAVRVATPERWPRKLSAVRSAASSARAGPAGEQHLGGHLLPPLPLDDEVVDVLDPALAHRLGDRRQAEDDAGLLLHDPRPPAGLLGDRRLRGDVAAAEVLGRARGRRCSLEDRSSPQPRSARARPPQWLITLDPHAAVAGAFNP